LIIQVEVFGCLANTAKATNICGICILLELHGLQFLHGCAPEPILALCAADTDAEHRIPMLRTALRMTVVEILFQALIASESDESKVAVLFIPARTVPAHFYPVNMPNGLYTFHNLPFSLLS
jgi:hypothetical protein